MYIRGVWCFPPVLVLLKLCARARARARGELLEEGTWGLNRPGEGKVACSASASCSHY